MILYRVHYRDVDQKWKTVFYNRENEARKEYDYVTSTGATSAMIEKVDLSTDEYFFRSFEEED